MYYFLFWVIIFSIFFVVFFSDFGFLVDGVVRILLIVCEIVLGFFNGLILGIVFCILGWLWKLWGCCEEYELFVKYGMVCGVKRWVGEFDIMDNECVLFGLEFLVFFVWLWRGDYGLNVDFLLMIFLLVLLLVLFFFLIVLLLLFCFLCDFCDCFMWGFLGEFVFLLCLFMFEFWLFGGDVCF